MKTFVAQDQKDCFVVQIFFNVLPTLESYMCPKLHINVTEGF
jgi:hypothetical protein